MTAVGSAPAHAAAPATPRARRLAGTASLLRFDLRRERVRAPVWLIAITLTTVTTASAFAELYGDPAELDRILRTMGSPAGLAMTGPRHYLTDYTFGAMLSHELIGFVSVLVALMNIMIIVRHTRTEEETGRAELIRSTPVGRHAQLSAALVTAVIINIALALLLSVSLASMGIESIGIAGALLYGAAHAAVGLTFAAVAALTVQLTASARGATGIALAVAGLAYGLRAAGDVSESETLSWLSPIGWVQRSYPFLDNDWSPLLLNLALTVIFAAGGFALSTRRDIGAGLMASRQGSATASALLGTPIGAAIRMHRSIWTGFAAGAFAIGAMYGSILGQAADMISAMPQIDEALSSVGGETLIDSFASVIMMLLALMCSAYLVIGGLRPRAEESGGRAEPILSTGLSRTGWLASHVVVVAVGGALLLASAGLGVGVFGAVSIDDPGLVGRLVLASLAYAPALWVVLGLAVALYGWAPALAPIAWLVVVYGFVVGYLGTILQFPEWALDLSPFGWVPELPAAEMSWTPMVVLTAIAVALVIVGLVGFRRRDLQLK